MTCPKSNLDTSVLFLLPALPCLSDVARLSPSIRLGCFGDQPRQTATGATHGPPETHMSVPCAMPCSDRQLHVQKTFLSGMLERTEAAGAAEQDSAPAGRRAGPQTCRNWAIASCCIIKYVIAEQSWEGGLCRQRGDFSPCEVSCCAQQLSVACNGSHQNSWLFFFFSVFVLSAAGTRGGWGGVLSLGCSHTTQAEL